MGLWKGKEVFILGKGSELEAGIDSGVEISSNFFEGSLLFSYSIYHDMNYHVQNPKGICVRLRVARIVLKNSILSFLGKHCDWVSIYFMLL
jgi:hypothetical protein